MSNNDEAKAGTEGTVMYTTFESVFRLNEVVTYIPSSGAKPKVTTIAGTDSVLLTVVASIPQEPGDQPTEPKPTSNIEAGVTTDRESTPTIVGPEPTTFISTKPQPTSMTSTADGGESTITSRPNSSHGLSDGAAAGLAIGCIIAGLALGIIAAVLFLRRRRRPGKGSENLHQTDKQSLEPKGDVLVTVTPSKNDVELSQFLLDATPDKQIEGELHSLSELMFQHIENHYHRSPIQVDPAVLAQSLIHIGYSPASSGLDAEYVAALCLDPKTRQVGLRHVLSHAVFRSLDFSSGSSLSMLPPAVAAFLQTIPPAGNPGQNPSATSLALSRWRSLSTLLLHPAPADRTPLPVSAAEASPQAGALANELNTLLHFFVAPDPASHQNQTSHLQAVILECTRLGYVLISQPSDWRFVFGTAQSRAVVVCPGLEKLSHSDGNRYTSPREAVAVVTMLV